MAGISILRRLLMKQAMKESAPFQHEGIMSISKALSGNVDAKVKRWVESAKRQGQDIDKMSEQEIKYILELNKPKAPKVYSNEEAYEILNRFANQNKKGEVIQGKFGKPFKEEIGSVDNVINNITRMEPVAAMKEVNKVLRREGKYKNLSKQDSEKVFNDTDDWINQRDPADLYDYKNKRPFREDPNFDPDDPDFDPENFADGGVAGLLGERQGYAIGERVLPRNNLIGLDLGLGNINQGQNMQTAGILPTWLGGATKEEEALKQIQDYRKDQAPYKGLIDADILKDYPKKQQEWQEIENKIQDLKKQYPEDVNIQSAYLDDDEYDFSEIEGQTAAALTLPTIFGLIKGGVSKKALAEQLIKQKIAKEAGKGITKIINPSKYGISKTTPTTTGTSIIPKTRLPQQTSGVGGIHSGMKTTKTKAPKKTKGSYSRSYNPGAGGVVQHSAPKKSNSYQQASYARRRGAQGGRVPFAMGRRAFLKLLGVGGAGIAGLKTGVSLGGKKAATEVAKDVATEAAGTYPPPYFFKLVEKIKFMGDDVTSRYATKERQNVKRYKDYELTEDLETGEIVIKKRNEGSFYDQDAIISDEYIIYKPGQADELTKGKKPPSEYDEYTVRPDSEGRLKEAEDGLDSIDEILEEVGDTTAMTLKKADGGIARMLGE